ncbi:MAG: aldolase/citrate lyase family protein [Alphaproteobacteria bacterium]
MKTILITNQPDVAADAQSAGVSRIMVDLESIGKQQRQASRNTFISSHTKEDIATVRAVLDKAELIVRINPWHEGSHAEIDHAIKYGADMIMLPMITGMQQVHACAKAIAGRAIFLPLVETSYSMHHIGDIAAMQEVQELYIGLNDLHLSLGQDFLFEPLADGSVEKMAVIIKQQGKAFGFGGIAIMGSGELPAEKILGEHERLGSTRVILSSRFCKDINIEDPQGRKKRIQAALERMQQQYTTLARRNADQRQQDSEETCARIRHIAQKLQAQRKKIL